MLNAFHWMESVEMFLKLKKKTRENGMSFVVHSSFVQYKLRSGIFF